MSWSVWWIWASLGFVLLIFEVLLPGFVFLGFGLAALLLAGLLFLAPVLVPSFPVALVIFALFALVSWWVLRKTIGIRKSQVKIWDRDINDD